MGLVLTAAGLQQGFQWMAGTEWLDTVKSMQPYWYVRTLSGISMDIGMSLLVVNMMMTALTRPAQAAQARPIPAPAPLGGAPVPVGGAAE
jgi:cytochrome c oxidase cbb3-type subunit 1